MKKIKNLSIQELNDLALIHLKTLEVQKKLLKYWESTNIRYDLRSNHEKMCYFITDKREEIRETINMLENILVEIAANQKKFVSICSGQVQEMTKTTN
tara:strand:- start:12 stop:305 length:294 start_codon:yes stop_codon:yes gene_type:complete